MNHTLLHVLILVLYDNNVDIRINRKIKDTQGNAHGKTVIGRDIFDFFKDKLNETRGNYDNQAFIYSLITTFLL